MTCPRMVEMDVPHENKAWAPRGDEICGGEYKSASSISTLFPPWSVTAEALGRGLIRHPGHEGPGHGVGDGDRGILWIPRFRQGP